MRCFFPRGTVKFSGIVNTKRTTADRITSHSYRIYPPTMRLFASHLEYICKRANSKGCLAMEDHLTSDVYVVHVSLGPLGIFVHRSIIAWYAHRRQNII